MDEHIADTFLVFSSLEMSKLLGEGTSINRVHLLEGQIRWFLLADGPGMSVVFVDSDTGKQEPTNMMDTTCPRNARSICLMANPSSG